MGSPNGGIIGVVNPTSFGKCTVTSATTGSTTLTTQPGTRTIAYAVVAGGGGGAGGQNGGGGPMEGLLGLQILDMMGKKINKEDEITPTVEVKDETKGKK